MKSKTEARRKKRIRARLKEMNRGRKLVVFRSNRYISGQIVDLNTGKSLVSFFSKSLNLKKKPTKTKIAFAAGEELAKKAVKLGIKKVVFDRSGYRYHGRVKALAEGARAGGLKF